MVTLGLNWAERFEDGKWHPPRDEDVIAFLQVGTDYIPVEATDRNMAGLAAIARLISPGADERLRQVLQLLWETRDARQAGQGDAWLPRPSCRCGPPATVRRPLPRPSPQ